MENTIMNNQETFMIDEEISEQAADIAEQTVKFVLDISSETATILSMTPRDGYQKKLELICIAEDLSTKEKLQEISRAEDKYAQDLERNAETYKGIMWVKAGIVFSVVVGGLYFSTTPEGKKLVKSLLKMVV